MYKAELVRLEDRTVQVYFYDQAMNPLPLSNFAKTGKGILEVIKKQKTTRTPFDLALEGDAFTGKAPKARSKPFNIDVTVQEGTRKLLAAFDNLD